MLVRLMVADRASCRSTRDAVAYHVARDTADYGAFDTAFSVRRTNRYRAKRYCYAGTSKEYFHLELRLPAPLR